MLWIVTFSAIALACADSGSDSEQAEITGTAMYRERIMLPPNAVFEATLEDVSRADAPATVLGQATIEGAGPYEFSIAYDPSRIDERMSYSVRGKVSVDGQLTFTTDTAYPVLTRGAGADVELLLKRVPSSPAKAGGSELEGTHWNLTHLGGEAVDLGGDATKTPFLTLDAESGQAGGTGGCNRFTGGYELDGNKISFGMMASTMMACPEGTDVDRELAQALENTESYAISGSALQLMDPGGTVVAVFEARESSFDGE
jgi:putative lipoprotein